jgi:cobalt-zinc-cadmium efflux system outer membrane protein
MLKKLSILFVGLCFLQSTLTAQINVDTLHVKLIDAEKMFLDSNLLLLAQKYNVDASEALIVQAKLLPNPNFSIGHGLYSGQLHQFFPVGNNDETTADISQLIQLAGKRNKQIKLAQANVKLSEYQFFDLIRTLKYTLRTDFYNIYYLQESEKVYSEEINALQQVVNAFEQQEGKGYIAEKEVVRIKAQLYSLQSEYNDLQNQVYDLQSELRVVLQIKPGKYIDPLTDSVSIEALDPAKYTLNTLLDSAYKNRTDLLIAQANSDINRLNYDYQKALAVPDLTLSVGYDEQGSFDFNFYSIGASIDLPFFNRNQGNIKSAKSMIDYSTATQKSTEATVGENVSRSLEKAYTEDKLYKNIDPKFSGDFDRLANEVLINYQKRNLGLLDFLDFYDSYKQNILQINSIKYNRVQSFEDINFYTGTNFFNQ